MSRLTTPPSTRASINSHPTRPSSWRPQRPVARSAASHRKRRLRTTRPRTIFWTDSRRARLTRAGLACPANVGLKVFWQQPGSSSPLPADFESFDCREHQLYAVRHFVDQLKYAHALPGGLNPGRAKVDGGALQTAILGTIQTFIVTKPQSG